MIDLELLLDRLPDAVFVCDEDGVVVYTNRLATGLIGHDDPEWFENNPTDGWLRGADGLLWPPSGETHEIDALVHTGPRLRRVRAHISPYPVRGAMGWLLSVRLRDPGQDKLAGMRTLATLIARQLGEHLGVVLATVSRALMDDPSRAEPLRRIHDAAHRSAELLRQVEALGGAVAELRPCALGAVVLESERVLRGVLGGAIALQVDAHEELGPIFGDPESLELVLGELGSWAASKCPGEGAFQVRVREIDELRVRLMIHVQGLRLSPAQRAGLFEPVERLGLAMAAGIVAHHGGRVLVEGTGNPEITFYLEFPRHNQGVRRRKPPGGTESVLVVEDDAETLSWVETALSRAGYHVRTAANGIAASVVLRQEHAHIDLLLTDAVLPGRSGPELIAEAQALQPGMPVLLMSGYSNEFLGSQLTGEVQLLRKPFGPAALTERIRALLDR